MPEPDPIADRHVAGPAADRPAGDRPAAAPSAVERPTVDRPPTDGPGASRPASARAAAAVTAEPADTTGPLAPEAIQQITAVEAAEEAKARPPKRGGLSIGAWLSIGWLVLIVGAALLAPVLPLDEPNATFAEIAHQGPFTEGHVLGGDSTGRDLLSLVIYGARNSLAIGFGAVGLGLVVGGFIGLYAGYYRGRRDAVIVLLLNVLLSFPALILALALVAVLRDRVSPLVTLILALGLISVPILARIVRANTLVWSEREFVLAARALGASNWRIMFREVLPNVLPSAFSIALLGVAVVIVAEAGLGVVGVGLPATSPSWGGIINDGRADLTSGTTAHIVFAGAAMVFLTVLTLNYLGDVVRARFDVREAAI
jgi:peptide/nickel transport system permease protein